MPNVDLVLFGFSEEELKIHLKSLDAREKKERLEPFDVGMMPPWTPHGRPPWPTRAIDLWLGDHRLLCGDSTDGGDVVRLFNGDQASLLCTDPPLPGGLLGRKSPSLKGQSLGDQGPALG